MKYSLLVLFFIPVFISAQSNYLNWGYSIGNAASDNGSSVSVDAAGNTYTAFLFQDTVDVDPGAGVQHFISKGLKDVCVSKLDAGGQLQWAFVIGGPGGAEVKLLALPSGDFLIAGVFSDSIDLDPGPDSLKIGSAGNELFAARYSASGQLIWGKRITTGSQSLSLTELTTDAMGNIYMTGLFNSNSSSIDFDPGPGNAPLANGFNSAEFILKLTSAGAYTWARAKTSSGDGWCFGWSVAVDAAGNVYTTGQFHGTVDMNSGAGVLNLNSNGYFDAYLSKLDASGNFLWAIPVSAGPGQDEGRGLVIDASGSIVVTGNFSETSDFDPGPGITQLTATGNSFESFLAKYSTGGSLMWVKKAGRSPDGNEWIIPWKLRQDGAGNLYTTGSFGGDCDFDPSAASFDINAGTVTSTYIQKLSSTGDFIWAGMISGHNGPDYMAVNNCGEIFLSATFRDSADAEPGTGTYTLYSAGQADFCFLKLSQSYWTGAVSTDWHNPLNWSCNTVPGLQSNVVIPSAAPRFPVVSANAAIKSIAVQPAASIQVEPGVLLHANGKSN
jgi:hypothetical protein